MSAVVRGIRVATAAASGNRTQRTANHPEKASASTAAAARTRSGVENPARARGTAGTLAPRRPFWFLDPPRARRYLPAHTPATIPNGGTHARREALLPARLQQGPRPHRPQRQADRGAPEALRGVREADEHPHREALGDVQRGEGLGRRSGVRG